MCVAREAGANAERKLRLQVVDLTPNMSVSNCTRDEGAHHGVRVRARNGEREPQAEALDEAESIGADDVADEAAVEAGDSDAEDGAGDEEQRVSDQKEGLGGVPGGKGDAEEGQERAEGGGERLFGLGRCAAGGGRVGGGEQGEEVGGRCEDRGRGRVDGDLR